MSKFAIQVENLGKEYIIGGAEQRHDSFRDMLTGALVAPFKKMRKLGGKAIDEELFWALKDISFDVPQGEVLGIIGGNGAGKSTLLKVLSRITSPTEGRVVTRGRVASLLEVGTGFHPELTGRENIYLNGAILGMSRLEIDTCFEQIVSFAEIDKFLDTPVKRYSSGMYVRLAFSVAAHLDVDILIVDEVLAVGDAKFQKKCLGQMRDLSYRGRTVLFVSHNMMAITTLCSECMLLDAGMLLGKGPTDEIVGKYLESSTAGSEYFQEEEDGRTPKIIMAKIVDTNGSRTSEEVTLAISVASPYEVSVSLELRISDNLGGKIGFGSLGRLNRSEMIELKPGKTHVEVGISIGMLAIGSYQIGIDIANPCIEYYDRVDNCLSLQVDRKNIRRGTEAFQQQWGFGSLEFHLEQLRLDHEMY